MSCRGRLHARARFPRQARLLYRGRRSFTLPLGAPARPLPEGRSFGVVKRVFNGKPSSAASYRGRLRHAGGQPVLAAADGTVVGRRGPVLRRQRRAHRPRQRLVTMYFHLPHPG